MFEIWIDSIELFSSFVNMATQTIKCRIVSKAANKRCLWSLIKLLIQPFIVNDHFNLAKECEDLIQKDAIIWSICKSDFSLRESFRLQPFCYEELAGFCFTDIHFSASKCAALINA